MNYLELCQMTAQQSGTIQGVFPTTVALQTNRLKQIVDFVREAYLDIQNAHRGWRWLQGEFYGEASPYIDTFPGTYFLDEYTAEQITRFSRWGFKGDGSDMGLSGWLSSTGPQEEGPLRWLNWDRFYETQRRGASNPVAGEGAPGTPHFYSVDPRNSLVISPSPDAAFHLRGKFRKSAQILLDDNDVPEMPEEFHTIIKDAALCYVEGFDEGPRIPVYRLRMLPNFSMLELHQLPQMQWGAPLA